MTEISQTPESQTPESNAPVSASAAPANTSSKDVASTAYIIYALYLASILVGITSIVGVIMAYINRGEGPEWLQSHYTFMIHTFWKGMLYGIISALFMIIGIGFLMLLALLVWFIVRCVKGLKFLGKQEAVPNATGWLF